MSLWTRLLAAVLVFTSVPGAQAQDPEAHGGLQRLHDWPEDPVNLIQNGSFEQLDASLPRSWLLTDAYHLYADPSPYTGAFSLRMQDSHLAAYTATAEQQLVLEPGFYNFRAMAKATGAGTNAAGSGGRLRMTSTGIATAPIFGTTGWTRLEARDAAVLPGESPALRIEAYARPNGTILFDDVEVRRLKPPAVEAFLLYPNYRGLLFDDRPQAIRMLVTARPEEVGLAAADARVRATLRDAAGQTVAWREWPAPAAPAELTLDASAAGLGPHELSLELLRASTAQVLFAYGTHRVVKLPAAERGALRAYVDPDNVAVLGGQRRFVLGIYDTGDYYNSTESYEPRIAKIAEAPLNMYINYWMGQAANGPLRAMMTALQNYGMHYLHTVNIWYENEPAWPNFPACEDGRTAAAIGAAAYTECRARELRGHPGLAGWYTVDEEMVSQARPVFDQYRTLNRSDPGGLTYIVQDSTRELTRWRDTTDVMGVDPYPIFNIPLGSASPLEQVTQWTEDAVRSVAGARPVWPVIQYFQFGGNGHWPTYDELRTMSYMAIVGGAKGLFYWSYGAAGLQGVADPAEREAYWQRLVGVTREIAGLEPALLSPDAPGLLSAVSTSAVRTLVKRVGATTYVIAVNNTGAAVSATFTMAEPFAGVQVREEGRSLPGGSSFTDSFAPYGVHVYALGDEAGTAQLSVSAVSVPPGGAVTVTLTGGRGGAQDWIALARAGAPPSSVLEWTYVGAGLATRSWTVHPATPGEYEFRLFLDNAYTVGATSPRFTVASAAAPELTLGSATAPLGTAVTVTLSNGTGGAQDWLALAPVGAPATTVTQWAYVGPGVTTRTWTATPPAAGAYEFRLFLNNGYTLAATSPAVTVTAPSAPRLTVAALSSPGDSGALTGPIAVTLSNGPGGATDWLALAPAGSASTTVTQWTWVGAGVTTRTWTVTPPASGTYEFRLFLNNSYVRAATSQAFAWGGGAGASLTPSVATVASGGSLSVSLAGAPGGALDWLALAPVGSPDTTVAQWAFVGAGVTTRAWTVTAPAPGTYEFRLFLNNTYTRAATSAPVTVTAAVSAPALAASTGSLKLGGSVTVTLTNGPGGAEDWIALAPLGSPTTNVARWTYVGAGIRNRTWTVVPPGAGAYEFRLFLNGGYVKTAASAPVWVSP